MLYESFYDSPLGKIILKSDGKALTGLAFCNESIKVPSSAARSLSMFAESIRWLDIYFHGGIPDFIPALSLEGTTFQKEVWEILKSIPYGGTMTYGEIGKVIAKRKNMKRMSSQAIGQAVGHNPIAIIIPCHRVIGANNKMTGYAGGIDKKIALLNLEKDPLNRR